MIRVNIVYVQKDINPTATLLAALNLYYAPEKGPPESAPPPLRPP